MLLPPPPNLRSLQAFTLFAVLLGAGGLGLPLKLSVTFQGIVSTNGPTDSLLSPTDGISVITPTEGQVVSKGQLLFRFTLPPLAVDIANLKNEIKNRKESLNESRDACSASLQLAKKNLAGAVEAYELTQKAFEDEAISRINLLQYRDRVNAAEREYQQVLSDCMRQERLLQAEILSFNSSLNSAKVKSDFVQELKASADGSVFSIAVKPGQRVKQGELLGKFTALGSTVAILRIGSTDRPFLTPGKIFEISSIAYSYLPLIPQRLCRITTISPDTVKEGSIEPGSSSSSSSSIFLASCQFIESPTTGKYPLLPGMDVQARGISIDSTLAQLLLVGFRKQVMSTSEVSAP